MKHAFWLGKHRSEETKKKISVASKGRIPWNKGVNGVYHASEKTKKKISDALGGISKSQKHCKNIAKSKSGERNPMYGHQYSDEERKRLSNGHMQRKVKLGYINSPETRKKLSLIMKHRSKEAVRKCLRYASPTTLELKMIGIIEKLNLPYKFVGNGKFFIENKCPDFINCNGEKVAIEVFYKGHKEEFRGGLEEWKKQRQKLFAKYGWKLLFFDETQINENSILKSIRGD